MPLELLTAKQIERLYAPLFSVGALGDSWEQSGFLRASWSPEENAAFAYIRAEAEAIGLVARFDEIGNLWLEEPGRTHYVECGSHLDTVVRGGNFDGVAGVVAGLAALQQIIKSGVERRAGVRLRLWRGEESGTYAVGCKGSRAAFGVLPAVALEKQFKDLTLAQAIAASGYSVEPILNGTPTISQAEIDSILTHVELHIEQANFLEQQGLDIGIVTSIRGPSRWNVVIEGRFDHSGGTAMGTDFRRDANLALGYMLVELDALANQALGEGHDLVQTVGVINADPQFNAAETRVYQNATAKVSGFAYFSLDIRSRSTAFRSAYVERAHQCIQAIAARFKTSVRIEKISETDPCEELDAQTKDIALTIATELNYGTTLMPCGALHDCVYLGANKRSDGSAVPIGMILIPCRDGISHSPEEFTSFEAIARGANVLAQTLLAMARA